MTTLTPEVPLSPPGFANPVTVTPTIGDDSGTTSVTADIQ